MPTRRIVALALAVVSLYAVATAGAAPGPAGSLRVRGCVTAAAVAGCVTAALADTTTKSAAISADGATVYTTGGDGSTLGVLAAWARDRTTGALTLRNCASYDLGTCIGAGGMNQPGQIAVGPHAVYVTGNQGTEVDEFPTAPDGSLNAPATCVGSGSCSAAAGDPVHGDEVGQRRRDHARRAHAGRHVVAGRAVDLPARSRDRRDRRAAGLPERRPSAAGDVHGHPRHAGP